MREIDEHAMRSHAPVSVADLKTIDTKPATYREQHRAHIIDMARWLADTAPNADPTNPKASMRASEARQFTKRLSEITELRMLAPADPLIQLSEHMLLLESL